MFENERYRTPSRQWGSSISSKSQAFRQQIRAKQINQLKQSIRSRYSIIINYSEPESCIAELKLAIAKRHFQLQQIISTVSAIMPHYQLSRQISQHRIIQMIIVAIDDNNQANSKQNLILKWLEMLYITTQYWPDLWTCLYNNTTSLLWAILVDQCQSIDFCIQIQNLLRQWKQKCNIVSSPSRQNLIHLFRSNNSLCPVVLEIIGEHINTESQQRKYYKIIIQS